MPRPAATAAHVAGAPTLGTRALGAVTALALGALAALALPEVARAAPPPVRDGERVRVEGTHFVVDGAPFAFVGANVSVTHGALERSHLDATLDAAAADGLSVVRVWAFGEAGGEAPAYWDDYAYRRGPEGWLDASFVHLDHVLAAARARNLRVILVLANRWRDYGGVPAYLGWAGAPAPEGRELESFLSCASCLERYREHVRRVVSRTSTVTGVPYRDDPTILAYEPMNEGGAVAPDAEDALAAFVSSTGRLVRSLDPSHLFSAGDIGYTGLRERAQWLRVQSLPEVDYCDAHLYPEGDPRIRGAADVARVVDDVAQLALHVAHKPLVFGEFGFTGPTRGHPATPRPRAIDAFLSAAFRDGVSGALLWIYAPWTGTEHDHSVVVGGPPAVDRRAREVRHVLARQASRVAAAAPTESNPRLGDAVGTTPLFASLATLRGPSHAPPHWQHLEDAWHLRLDPLSFRVARFERLGLADQGPVRHFWGSGRGSVEWSFSAPAPETHPPSRLVVRARISSELPGTGEGSPPTNTSLVDVYVDDVWLGSVTAPVDDGLGHVVALEVADTALLGRAFATTGRHLLRFEAHESPGAGGLDLYVDATGLKPVPPEVAADLPAHVELDWVP